MSVRAAGIDEAPALAAIHAQCFTVEVWDGAAIAALLTTPGTFALADDGFTGFILVRTAAEESEILTLGVTPAARRRGIASALVSAASECAVKAGARVMFLEVNASNYPAIALYKQFGFVGVGVRKDYYAGVHGMREDALVLRAPVPLLRVGISLQLG